MPDHDFSEARRQNEIIRDSMARRAADQEALREIRETRAAIAYERNNNHWASKVENLYRLRRRGKRA